MPKMKTHKGAAKRFHVTGTGKVMSMAHHRNNKRMKKRAESQDKRWAAKSSKVAITFACICPSPDCRATSHGE